KLQQWCVAHANRRRLQELRVVWDVTKLVAENMPQASVHVFGSFMTGLAIPQSDVDVLISNASTPRHFHLLAQAIRNRAGVTAVNAISTAHVPVIKLCMQPPPLDSLPLTSQTFASAVEQLSGPPHTGGGGRHSLA